MTLAFPDRLCVADKFNNPYLILASCYVIMFLRASLLISMITLLAQRSTRLFDRLHERVLYIIFSFVDV